ncbi:MAG: endonuclease/exonuclease/phosphatase family protein [Caldilineaceae bacterium]
MVLLTLVYVVATFALWLLAYSPLRSTWWTQLLTLFSPWFFLPVPLLVALAWLNGTAASAYWLILPALLFGWEYGRYFLPKAKKGIQPQLAVSTAVPPTNLRVMTWNILYTNTNVKAALAAIQLQQPDVLALQELGVTLAQGLVAALATEYPYQMLHASDSPSGYGIFSRYPIPHSIPPKLHGDHHWCHEVTIALDGEKITVINAHPRIPDIHLVRLAGIPIPVGFDTELQDVQLRRLLQRVDQVRGRLLVMGDFNLSERQPMYGEFACRLHDAQREAGWGLGFTFPTNLAILDYFKVPIPALPMLPFLRLDYIFYNDGWQPLRTSSGRAAGSDHCYLVVDLQLVGCT